jgi:cobalt-zinc-cadmium efflux system membrane fusion protein
VVAGVAAGPQISDWWQKTSAEKAPPEREPETVQLTNDYQAETAAATMVGLLGSAPGSGGGLTVLALADTPGFRSHPGLLLTADVVKSLLIENQPARPVRREKALPALLGQVAYDIDRLYPVRSIANGKVIHIETRFDPSLPREPRYRPLGFGDQVKEGDLLAVVRSPDLADKKGAFVDALLDLWVDQEKLRALEGPYRRGAIPEGTYRDALAKVQKDENAVGRTRRTLELVPLSREEIEDLEKEAEDIRKLVKGLARGNAGTKSRQADSKEYRKRVERWARIEVRAPATGTLVEKNTNVGDIADPGKDPPLFRIADLGAFSIWIHPPEEYLPVLQKLLREHPAGEVRIKMRLQSDPSAPALTGTLLRFAPSIDPNNRSPLLLGRVENQGNRLLVGQLFKVTIMVPQDPGLVEIPMKALNEVGGQSLVFVAGRPSRDGRPRYFLRRVAVVNRLEQMAQVRSRLTGEDRAQMHKEKGRGLRPIEPLGPGERVATGGVVEMTDALEGLLAGESSK